MCSRARSSTRDNSIVCAVRGRARSRHAHPSIPPARYKYREPHAPARAHLYDAYFSLVCVCLCFFSPVPAVCVVSAHCVVSAAAAAGWMGALAGWRWRARTPNVDVGGGDAMRYAPSHSSECVCAGETSKRLVVFLPGRCACAR